MTVRFFNIFDVFRLIEQFQGIMHLYRRKMIGRAESENVELEHIIESGSNGYLEERCKTAIDMTNEIAFGIFLNQVLAKLVLIIFRNDKYGFGRQTVTSCTTGFLEILLDRWRKVEMNHLADICLVDTHSKGIGGYDYRRIASHPSLLFLYLDIRT